MTDKDGVGLAVVILHQTLVHTFQKDTLLHLRFSGTAVIPEISISNGRQWINKKILPFRKYPLVICLIGLIRSTRVVSISKTNISWL
jgi:hypothetical protein